MSKYKYTCIKCNITLHIRCEKCDHTEFKGLKRFKEKDKRIYPDASSVKVAQHFQSPRETHGFWLECLHCGFDSWEFKHTAKTSSQDCGAVTSINNPKHKSNFSKSIRKYFVNYNRDR